MTPLVWIEVDTTALARNARALRSLCSPAAALGVVVKANGYGHGAMLAAQAALEGGASWLITHSLEEALELREAGLTGPLLALGHVPPPDLAQAFEHHIDLTVFAPEALAPCQEAARRCGHRGRLHIKVETGTHRHGVGAEVAVEMARAIRACPELELCGLSTHFADIEDTIDHTYAMGQLQSYCETVALVEAAVGPVALHHTAASAALILFEQTHFDLLRAGISFYGLWPSPQTRVSFQERHPGSALGLEPALTLKTTVAQIKAIPAQAYVSYGRTYRTSRPTRLAVLPVGYSDGLDRGLSNVGHGLVRGQRAPIRGRVCMNICMIDITDIPEAQAGDEVVLLGRQGDEEITADQMAGLLGTINYEVVARLSRHLPRVARRA